MEIGLIIIGILLVCTIVVICLIEFGSVETLDPGEPFFDGEISIREFNNKNIIRNDNV